MKSGTGWMEGIYQDVSVYLGETFSFLRRYEMEAKDCKRFHSWFE